MKLLFLIIFSFFSSVFFAQHYTYKENVKTYEKKIIELQIVNDDFLLILDSIIAIHKKCKNYKDAYSWNIYIKNVENEESEKIESFYISQSYFIDAPIEGYGYFYYNNILFMLKGNKNFDIFKFTATYKKFKVFKDEPTMFFDPPRWLYYYWNKKFYFADSSHC